MKDITLKERLFLLKERALWYMKQLLPLTYRTFYGDVNDRHFVVWNMWLGRCFNITDVIIQEK